MRQRYLLHIVLFLLTVCTTMMAGAEMTTGSYFAFLDFSGSWPELISGGLNWSEIWKGIPFSFAFLSFLTVHEFGHYFTSVYHKVRCSLPYYIPIFFPGMPNIGSFGAVIRIREMPSSRRKYFDIGVAGPLAGFVVAIGLLLYGFTHLPPVAETIMGIHPVYESMFGGVPTEAEMAGASGVLRFGGSLLFEGFKWLFSGDPNMPPSFEMQHYPFLLVGFLTLFFTALNLLPIGQLDGGHVMYGLFGARRAGIIGRIAVFCLLWMGGLGMISPGDILAFGLPVPFWDHLFHAAILVLYIFMVYYVLGKLVNWGAVWKQALAVFAVVGSQFLVSWLGEFMNPNVVWLLYSLLVVRMVGLDHPVAVDDRPLSPVQKVMGWAAIVIFVLCFSPQPIVLT